MEATMNKVLVLSKDSSLRQRYVKELVKSGFHVADASDFLDGMLTATKSKFDIIIIDEEVYGAGDRLEFSKVRKYSNAFIILLGKSSVNEIPTSGDGFDAYFQRAANPQELITYIKGVVNQPEGKREMMPARREVSSVASSQSETVFNIVTDLEQQIARIRAVMVGLSQMQGKISEAEDIVRKQQQALEVARTRLNEVNAYLDGISGNHDSKG